MRKFGTCQLLHHLVPFKEINAFLKSSCKNQFLQLQADKTQSGVTSKFKKIVSSLKTYYATHKNVKMNDTYTLMEFYVNHSKEYGTVDTLEAYQCAQKLNSFHELCEYDSKSLESLTKLNQVGTEDHQEIQSTSQNITTDVEKNEQSSNVDTTSQKGKSPARENNFHTIIEQKNRSSSKHSRNVCTFSQDGYKSPNRRPHNRITDKKGNTSPLRRKSYYRTDKKGGNFVSKDGQGVNKPDQRDGQSSAGVCHESRTNQPSHTFPSENKRLIKTINSQLNRSSTRKRQQYNPSEVQRNRYLSKQSRHPIVG